MWTALKKNFTDIPTMSNSTWNTGQYKNAKEGIDFISPLEAPKYTDQSNVKIQWEASGRFRWMTHLRFQAWNKHLFLLFCLNDASQAGWRWAYIECWLDSFVIC